MALVQSELPTHNPVQFKCINCEDSCCSKKVVALNGPDVKRIASTLENPDDIFNYIIFRYLKEGRTVKGDKVEGVLTLKQVDGSCIFLKDSLCSIHPHRPLACRLYPFNPIFTKMTKGWRTEYTIDSEGCPGLDNVDGEIPQEVKDLARQWRDERSAYDLFVFEWNKREDKHRSLIDFVKRCLK